MLVSATNFRAECDLINTGAVDSNSQMFFFWVTYAQKQMFAAYSHRTQVVKAVNVQYVKC